MENINSILALVKELHNGFVEG